MPGTAPGRRASVRETAPRERADNRAQYRRRLGLPPSPPPSPPPEEDDDAVVLSRHELLRPDTRALYAAFERFEAPATPDISPANGAHHHPDQSAATFVRRIFTRLDDAVPYAAEDAGVELACPGWSGAVVERTHTTHSPRDPARRTLYVHMPANMDRSRLRDNVLAVLDLASERAAAGRVVFCLERSTRDLVSLLHGLLYVGGHVVSAGGAPDPWLGAAPREALPTQVAVAPTLAMVVQSRLQPLLDSAKQNALNNIIQFAIFYARNYEKIQSVERVVYFAGLAVGIVTMIRPRKSRKSKAKPADGKPAKKDRVEVNGVFFNRLRTLLHIIIPGWRSREMFLLIAFSAILVARTFLSLKVADLEGSIVSALVRGNKRSFFMNIGLWMGIAVPAVFTNSMISFLSNSMSLAFRERLTKYIQRQYLSNLMFYKLSNLDDRIRNADQLIVEDVNKFSRALSTLYGNIALPVLDVFLYNYKLSKTVGVEMLVLSSLVIRLTTFLLRLVTPPFGQYTATEQQLEGEYRSSHTRLIENAEEVAFFRGQLLERRLIDRAYFSLIKHINNVFHVRITHGMFEEGVIKWLWGAMGLVICSAPVFLRVPALSAMTGASTRKLDTGARTEMFVTNRRLLLSSSDAIGRIMYSYKDLSELAGYTTRVMELIEVMEDINRGDLHMGSIAGSEKSNVFQKRGDITEGTSDITFDKVPIVSPTGDVLLPGLSFNIKPGQHLLVIGPNGCGKSSMFRTLGGLWPVYGGRVSKPYSTDFTYIPQRPYLSLGTLRDQVIYPDTVAEMHAKGVSDDDLLKILDLLQIGSIVAREGGWDVEREWRDALSGGDKQRIAMARLFYHKPKYAILDECTSAVTLEVEKIMYDHATELGITMMTVSHRPSLWKYHSHVLQYDGQGSYVFTELDAEKRLKLQDEKQHLEQLLLQLPKWKQRLADLKAAVSENRVSAKDSASNPVQTRAAAEAEAEAKAETAREEAAASAQEDANEGAAPVPAAPVDIEKLRAGA
ncbi:ATP-binding cassette long-chain fatty acid transporter pxa2 [Malassezia cuniculi]|uniref:ATP-binding cassette long-chain fatty acid transporter pxa2 n=1 Tax=Malassezia cuniculi TaxID=948313 RepID=A0AAF0ET09_9BASI|nr:ATP-binding cassette long-chain fatty acid transporter pxa2 [Malassezia cuniculi]